MKYFFCYDKNLFNLLSSKGFRFITKARNINNDKVFSLYLMTEELSQVIDEWTKSKK